MIEAGVRLVMVVWVYLCPDGNVANVWDNHGGPGSLGGIIGYEMLKENTTCRRWIRPKRCYWKTFRRGAYWMRRWS